VVWLFPYLAEDDWTIPKHKRVWVVPSDEVMLAGEFPPHATVSGDFVLCKLSTTAPIVIPGQPFAPICTSRDDVKFTDVEFTDSWGRHVVMADISRIGCVLLRGCGIRPATGCVVQPPTRPWGSFGCADAEAKAWRDVHRFYRGEWCKPLVRVHRRDSFQGEMPGERVEATPAHPRSPLASVNGELPLEGQADALAYRHREPKGIMSRRNRMETVRAMVLRGDTV
jgi:hypothetical protein